MDTPQQQTQISSVQHRSRAFLNTVSVYGLELAVAMVSIILLAIATSVSTYAFCNLINNLNDDNTGYGALWFAASAIVWLPVAFIFFARVRGQMQQRDQTARYGVERGFVITYQCVTMLAVVGFAFAAIYNFFTSLVSANDVIGSLVTSCLPAVISALLFGLAFVAFFRHPVATRRSYLQVLTILTILIIVPTLVLSVISLRGGTTHPRYNHTYNNYNQQYDSGSDNNYYQ